MENTCSICLNSILSQHITACGHKFCFACILAWVGQQEKMDLTTSCPICRTHIKVERKEDLQSETKPKTSPEPRSEEGRIFDTIGEIQHNMLFYSMHPGDKESREILSYLTRDDILNRSIQKICVYPNASNIKIPQVVLKINRVPILFISGLDKPLIGHAAVNWCKNLSTRIANDDWNDDW